MMKDPEFAHQWEINQKINDNRSNKLTILPTKDELQLMAEVDKLWDI